MKIHCLSLLCLSFLLGFSIPAFAQPANDECVNAITLPDVSNFCSALGEYTIEGATESPLGNPSCWPFGSQTNDIWFAFTAVATDLNITMVGNTGGANSGGTLNNPQFALYQGDCTSTLTEIQCASDGFNFNVAETLAGPLTVGQTYYIRMDARDGNTGTFQLCINNFNQVPDPNSDCNTGVILCDKSPFTVESVEGTGNDPNEISDASCITVEHSSAWYKWTCDDPGTLSFTLTPNNPSDDLDFVLFELPNGVEDCTGKMEIRCMASGEQVGSPFSVWEPCTGATGLNDLSTDISESPGCAPGDDNFISSIVMEEGKSYALIIDNFSNTGSGFSIEFGGTGTFLGPTANFITDIDEVCLNESVTFNDASTSVSGIEKWEWNFGVGSNPSIGQGEGPHNINYSSPGLKSITLKITSSAGCIITHIGNINVHPIPEAEGLASPDYCGENISTGSISVNVTAGTPPFLYDWNNDGEFNEDSTLMDIAAGSYSVVILDGNGCLASFDFEVPEGLALEPSLDPVQPPTCNGDSDGSISVSVQVGTEPITYDFGNGPQANNVLSGIPAGNYSVTVTDGSGCSGAFDIPVVDFPVLELGIDAQNISCFGEADGIAIGVPSGGAGGYNYAWNTGSIEEEITNLVEGNYFLTITDMQGCTTISDAMIVEPPELFLDSVRAQDVICFGDETGTISVFGSGGTPPFEYSIDGGMVFQPSLNFSDLGAGTYSVILSDNRGCSKTWEAFINEPPPLIVEAGEDQTIELGETAQLQPWHTPPFRPVTWAWSPIETLDCFDCDDPIAFPFGTTTYKVMIEDATNCRSTDSVTIHVILNYPVYIPNVFSPNSDGANDTFTIYGGGAARIIRSLKIFSRWGSMVFEGYDMTLGDESMGWNGMFKGEMMNPAVFAYVAEVEFIDGVVLQFEGDITLVR